MFQKPGATLCRIRRSRGFALIIVISMLGLLLLVLVSLATLTRIETSVGSNSLKAAQARENARFALSTAIGELQRHLGPDTRISGRAELAFVSPETPSLTGVWNHEGGLRTWLISGNERIPNAGNLADDIDLSSRMTPDIVRQQSASGGSFEALQSPTSQDQRPTFVRKAFRVARGGSTRAASLLVGPYTAGHGGGVESRYVLAPMVDLKSEPAGGDPDDSSDDATFGRYAWWVGDEGVKASVAETDRTREKSSASTYRLNYGGFALDDNRSRIQQLALPRQRIEPVFDLNRTPWDDPDADDWEKFDTVAQLGRVLTPSQLAFVRFQDPTAPDNPAADDQVDPAVLRASYHDATVSSRGVLADAANGGLRLDLSNPSDGASPVFRGFLRSRPVAATDTESVFSSQAVVESGETSAFAVSPVVLEFVLSLELELPSPVAGGEVDVVWRAEAVVWNPYNATIANTSGSDRLRVRVEGTGDIVRLSETGREIVVDLPQTLINAATADCSFDLVTVSTPLEPGGFRRVEVTGSTVARMADGAPINLTADSGPYVIELDLNDRKVAYATVDYPDGNPGAARYVARHAPPAPPAGSASLVADGRVVFRYRLNWDDQLQFLDFLDPRELRDIAAFSDFRAFASSAVELAALTEPSPGVTVPSEPRVVFDALRQEPVSLAALMDFPITPDGSNVLRSREFGRSSTAQSIDPIDGEIRGVNSLWDRAYFSTISGAMSGWNPLAGDPLANTRIEVIQSNRSLPKSSESAARTYLANLASDEDDRRIASAVLVRGAFNVNSTSPRAWSALIGGTRIEGWDYSGGSPVTLNHSFFRFPQTAQQLTTEYSVNPNGAAVWRQGVRELLDDSQINRIAFDLVSKIRARGRPFASVEEFINSDVLQAALDAENVNNGISESKAPAYLTQADMLASWAPFLTVRSDTFTIRAYGETVNPVTEQTEARAWCEAIVQRVPEYVDPDLNEPWDQPTGINADFGRRFVITSFRWLSPDDI